jgi:hypothetical protein
MTARLIEGERSVGPILGLSRPNAAQVLFGATVACRPATPPLRTVRARSVGRVRCRGSARVVTPGQPLGFPWGSRRVVVIAVRAAWRALPRPTSAAAPGSGPARRGAWPAASPARRSDRGCGRGSGAPAAASEENEGSCGERAGASRGLSTATPALTKNHENHQDVIRSHSEGVARVAEAALQD